MVKTVLFVCTSCDKLSDGKPTGCWVEEVAAPYYVLTDALVEVEVASIQGGKVPWDEASLSGDFVTNFVRKYQSDETLQSKCNNSKPLKDVCGNTYDAVFLPGGHGIAFDGPGDKDLAALLSKTWEDGHVVAAVCHGPCGLVNAVTPDGVPIVKGKKVAGFSNSEEEAVGKTDVVPFLLEDKLKELGGKYDKGQDWGEYAVADGLLITGQNPQSSEKVGKLICAALGVEESKGKFI